METGIIYGTKLVVMSQHMIVVFSYVDVWGSMHRQGFGNISYWDRACWIGLN
jgi:hypothetical protein